MLAGSLLYNGGYTYATQDGSLLPDKITGVVAAFADGIIHGSGNELRALKSVMKEAKDRKGNTIMVPAHKRFGKSKTFRRERL